MATVPEFSAKMLPVNEIFVVGERRPLDEGAVAALTESIFGKDGRKGIGLQVPIDVRPDDDIPDPDTGEPGMGGYALVAGHHRLEAYRRHGEEYIPAIIREWTEVEAELWEISENLHRAGLTAEHRRQYLRRYAELIAIRDADKVPQSAAVSGTGGRGNKGISAKVAEETGVSKDTVERALNPRRVERARAKAAETKSLKEEAEEKLAALLAEHIPGEQWSALKANLHTAGCHRIAKEFDRLTGVSVFDNTEAGRTDHPFGRTAA